jgi:hypothetical protein
MSEPWVTMSSNTFSQVKEEKDSPAKRGSAPFHPALLQPRFPQPLMAIPTQPHAPGMPHRMPTIEEFAPLCNTNGRIGIYTKEVSVAHFCRMCDSYLMSDENAGTGGTYSALS